MLRYCTYCKIIDFRDLKANSKVAEDLRTIVPIEKKIGQIDKELNIVFANVLQNSGEREAGNVF